VNDDASPWSLYSEDYNLFFARNNNKSSRDETPCNKETWQHIQLLTGTATLSGSKDFNRVTKMHSTKIYFFLSALSFMKMMNLLYFQCCCFVISNKTVYTSTLKTICYRITNIYNVYIKKHNQVPP
jgi:hypothetical protein